MGNDDKIPQRVWFDTMAAAEFLTKQCGYRIAEQTMRKYRTTGEGPAFNKVGRAVVYRREALETWAAAKVSAPRLSTTGAAR
jgi:hypothetical protein